MNDVSPSLFLSLLIFRRNIGFIALKVMTENLLQLSVFETKGHINSLLFNPIMALQISSLGLKLYWKNTSPCNLQQE